MKWEIYHEKLCDLYVCEVDHITAQQATGATIFSTSKQTKKYDQLVKTTYPRIFKIYECCTVVDIYSRSFDTTTITNLMMGLNFAVTLKHLLTEDIVCRVEDDTVHLPSCSAEEIRYEMAGIVKKAHAPKSYGWWNSWTFTNPFASNMVTRTSFSQPHTPFPLDSSPHLPTIKFILLCYVSELT